MMNQINLKMILN